MEMIAVIIQSGDIFVFFEIITNNLLQIEQDTIEMMWRFGIIIRSFESQHAILRFAQFLILTFFIFGVDSLQQRHYFTSFGDGNLLTNTKKLCTFLRKVSHFCIKHFYHAACLCHETMKKKPYNMILESCSFESKTKGTKTSYILITSKNQENSNERERESAKEQTSDLNIDRRTSCYLYMRTHTHTNKIFLVSCSMCCVK